MRKLSQRKRCLTEDDNLRRNWAKGKVSDEEMEEMKRKAMLRKDVAAYAKAQRGPERRQVGWQLESSSSLVWLECRV